MPFVNPLISLFSDIYIDCSVHSRLPAKGAHFQFDSIGDYFDIILKGFQNRFPEYKEVKI